MRASGSVLAVSLLLACGDTDGAAEAGSSTQPADTGTPPADPGTDAPPATTGSSTPTTGTDESTSTTSTTSTSTSEVTTGAPADPVPLRVLFINVGNASPQYGCWEYKLCRPGDVAHVREYIAAWRPDIVLLSEVLRAAQLTGLEAGGPILPDGYAGACGESRDRDTGEPAAWDADGASHEHECVAWRSERVAPVPGGTRSAYGADGCNYDFTGFRARLLVDGVHEWTAVAVHPDSMETGCRVDEISRYWSELADGARVAIGGDWNSDRDDELQRPRDFAVAYLRGQHWDLATHDEYSAEYLLGFEKQRFDHAFVRGGAPCSDCGADYGTADLAFASALGGYDDHPRADAGEGLDHRQLLVDLRFLP